MGANDKKVKRPNPRDNYPEIEDPQKNDNLSPFTTQPPAPATRKASEPKPPAQPKNGKVFTLKKAADAAAAAAAAARKKATAVTNFSTAKENAATAATAVTSKAATAAAAAKKQALSTAAAANENRTTAASGIRTKAGEAALSARTMATRITTTVSAASQKATEATRGAANHNKLPPDFQKRVQAYFNNDNCSHTTSADSLTSLPAETENEILTSIKSQIELQPEKYKEPLTKFFDDHLRQLDTTSGTPKELKSAIMQAAEKEFTHKNPIKRIIHSIMQNLNILCTRPGADSPCRFFSAPQTTRTKLALEILHNVISNK